MHMNAAVVEQNKAWIDTTWEKIDKKLSKTAIKSRNKLPYTTIEGVHGGAPCG